MAVVLAAVAFRIIAANAPEDIGGVPSIPPASAPDGIAAPQKLVAGAGIVEPSSELLAIASAVPGVIDAVNVHVGQSVKQGDVLFTLDSRTVRAEQAQRQATLQAAHHQVTEALVQLEESQANLVLSESLWEARAIAKEELRRRRFSVEAASARVTSARAAVTQAQAAVDATAVELAQLQIRAPMDATVLRLAARPGQFAPAAQLQEPLVTLGRLNPLHVRVDVDEADIGRLGDRLMATVSPRGDSTNKVLAQFVRIEPLVTPKRLLTNALDERVDTRVLQIIFALPAETEGFYPGQQVDAFVVADAGG